MSLLNKKLFYTAVVVGVLAMVATGTFATTPRYTIGGSGDERTVVDGATGLEWQQAHTLEAGGVDWKSAMAHCEGLSYGGGDDWRLPNVTELLTIVDEKLEDPPAINYVFFPDFETGNGYWTSTTSRKTGSSAYVVHFGEYDSTVGTGGVSPIAKTATALVLCVRGG